MTKPFNPRELLARIRAVMRRTSGQESTSDSHLLEFGAFRLDLNAHRLTREQRTVPLTTGEFDLLSVFAQHPNRLLDRDRILDLLTGAERSPFDRSIDVRVTRLRGKIEPDPSLAELYQDHLGQGVHVLPRQRLTAHPDGHGRRARGEAARLRTGHTADFAPRTHERHTRNQRRRHRRDGPRGIAVLRDRAHDRAHRRRRSRSRGAFRADVGGTPGLYRRAPRLRAGDDAHARSGDQFRHSRSARRRRGQRLLRAPAGEDLRASRCSGTAARRRRNSCGSSCPSPVAGCRSAFPRENRVSSCRTWG